MRFLPVAFFLAAAGVGLAAQGPVLFSAKTCASHQFMNVLSTAGVITCAQPAASDVSGLAASATTDTTNASNISSGALPISRRWTDQLQLKTTDYTIVVNDDTILSNSGARTYTLPTESTAIKPVLVCLRSGGAVTVQRGGSDVIYLNGAGTATSTVLHRVGECLRFVPGDSGFWFVENDYRTETVQVGNADTNGQRCTSTPCTIYLQSGAWVTSITRAATGQYTINIVSGIFSAAPSCQVNGYNGGTTAAADCVAIAGGTSTSQAIVCNTFAGAATDAVFKVTCTGPR